MHNVNKIFYKNNWNVGLFSTPCLGNITVYTGTVEKTIKLFFNLKLYNFGLLFFKQTEQLKHYQVRVFQFWLKSQTGLFHSLNLSIILQLLLYDLEASNSACVAPSNRVSIRMTTLDMFLPVRHKELGLQMRHLNCRLSGHTPNQGNTNHY